MTLFYEREGLRLHLGNCLHVMAGLAENSVDTVITDPPYGLSKEPDIVEVLTHWLAGDDYEHKHDGFMGRSWDSFVPGPSVWRECFRVLKPGGTLLCFASSRTFDLMGISLRLAGFELHPFLAWVYGSGFPKATNLGKMLDRDAGIERNTAQHKRTERENFRFETQSTPSLPPQSPDAKTWDGWFYGKQALKPAIEPILMAVKPHEGRMVDSCRKWGVAGLNIDGARIPTGDNDYNEMVGRSGGHTSYGPDDTNVALGKGLGRPLGDTWEPERKGRFPANLILTYPNDAHDADGNLLPNPEKEEVLGCFPYSKSTGGDGYKNSIFCGGKKTGGTGWATKAAPHASSNTAHPMQSQHAAP